MTDEKRDPPIEEQNYFGGVTVVNLGDVRVARGLTRRATSSCPHRQLMYDQRERRIWCKQCEHDVEPFEAFTIVCEGMDQAFKDVERRRLELDEAEKFQVRSIAAKRIDEAWRKRDTVPACPHCQNGLFPEDFKTGIGLTLGRDYATAKLQKIRSKD